MTVARILAAKGDMVDTARADASMRNIVKVLAGKHIGALVIVDLDGAMQGIVSEHDVVRAIAANGTDALEEPVASYMTRKVVTASEADTVIEVAKRMSAGRFRHMPVIEDGLLIGLVSLGDTIKYRLEKMEAEQSALQYIATA